MCVLFVGVLRIIAKYAFSTFFLSHQSGTLIAQDP